MDGGVEKSNQSKTGSDRTTDQKVEIFASLFVGLRQVYGTYDPETGRARQVKAPVTQKVSLDHLTGQQPYGVYLLAGDRIKAAAVDFDDDDANPPLQFMTTARRYGISAYIERSKSKGYHVWVFFEGWVLASKARLVIRHILEEIGEPNIEVFPKQDALDERNQYGNFIYAPLFGRLVREGRTVFLDPENGLEPYPNQWDFLESVQRVSEATLDEIMDINNLNATTGVPQGSPPQQDAEIWQRSFGLPPCAQRMLVEGVSAYQRVACFRLAVAFRKAGVSLDATIAALNVWALKNQPTEGKDIITRREINEQASAAYRKPYRSCGCDDPAVRPYCDPSCPLRKRDQGMPRAVCSNAKRS